MGTSIFCWVCTPDAGQETQQASAVPLPKVPWQHSYGLDLLPGVDSSKPFFLRTKENTRTIWLGRSWLGRFPDST